MRPLNALEQRVLDLLRATKGSVSHKAIRNQLDVLSVVELSVALDTLALRDLIDRIDTGREVTFAALAAPAAASTQPAAAKQAVQPPAPPAVPKPAAASPGPAATKPALVSRVSLGTTELNGQRILSFLEGADGEACTGRTIFDALNITQTAFSAAVRKLEAQGQVNRVTAGFNAPRYCLSPSAQVALAAPVGSGVTAAIESSPSLASLAVQPIDTATSTAVPAARETHTAVTEPAGSRDEPSSSISGHDFEPVTDELLAWHADQAERESRRRIAATGHATAGDFGDLNNLVSEAMPPAGFVLTDAMRNTGEAIPGVLGETVELLAATNLLIDAASYALWSDGRLHIESGDDLVILSQPATRSLITYLDQFAGVVGTL